ENSIISTNLRVAVDEVLQLEEPHRVGIGDMGIHVDIQHCARPTFLDSDQGLEGWSPHQVPTAHTLGPRVGAVCGDNRVPVYRVFHPVRAGLSAQLDGWS